ncbi:MAG: GNAT family N-acetyltransferase [Bdellovibrionales bacterium]|nr:GNAT family N-acetyltransferase [Bdellovibrionales bacterium]
MAIRAVKPGELPSLVSLVSEAFHYPEGQSISRDFPLLFAEQNVSNLWVETDEKGAIVAHAGTYSGLLKVEGEEISVAGIGGVFCREDHQGRGLATQLIERCCESLKARGAVLAFLWTGEHAFYRRSGFELVGRQWMIHAPVALAKKMADEAAGLKVEILEGVPRHEFLVESLKMLEAQPLGWKRTEAAHRTLLTSAGCRVFSAWEGNALSAWMVIDKGRDLQGYVHEWGGKSAPLNLLLAHVLEQGQRDLVVLSPQFTPEEAPWVYGLEKTGCTMDAGFMGMVKLLDIASLRSLAARHVENLGLNSTRLVMDREGELYRVGYGDVVFTDITEREFLKLVFGPEPTGVNQWDAIFPLRLWFWGMDSV